MSSPAVSVFRADAGATIGAGHVMRTLSLAQQWQDDGGGGVFVCASLPAPLHQRLEDEGVSVELIDVPIGSDDDAKATQEVLQRYRAKWLVLDGYNFDRGYESKLSQRGCLRLLIDDNGFEDFSRADIVLNQNLGASAALYPNIDTNRTRALLGSRYTLLQRAFRHAECTASVGKLKPFKRILVCLGGGVYGPVYLRLIAALQSVVAHGHRVSVICPNPEDEKLVNDRVSPDSGFRVLGRQQDLVTVLRETDVYIGSAGSTAWEVCFFAIAGIYLTLASNQIPIAKAIHSHRAGHYLGHVHDLSDEALQKGIYRVMSDAACLSEMARQARRLVDGKGTERVVMNMRELCQDQ